MSTDKQEPVAWRSWNDKDGFGFWDTKNEAESWCDLDFDSEPLYTTPPQREWVGLTEEDIQPAIRKAMIYYGYDPKHSTLTSGAGFCELIRAIEAKLREKNGC